MTSKNPSAASGLYSGLDPAALSGKLLLRQEIPLNDTDFSRALEQGLFRPLSPFINRLFKRQCRRCGNSDKRLLGVLPCAVCGHNQFYCRNCIEMGRVMACDNLYEWTGPVVDWYRHDNPCTWQGELTPAQKKAADSITQAVKVKERERLVWAVCGAGKTEMLFLGITEALKRGKRICLAAPRADVVRELKPRIANAFQQISIEALYGGSPDKAGKAQFIIATTHQLIRFQDAFDLMIIDEIDAFPYHADPSLSYVSKRSVKQEGTIIYLTATPSQQHKRLMNQRKLPHVFVPIRYHGYPLPLPQMKMCLSFHQDTDNLPNAFMSWLHHRLNPNRQLLIFVPLIAQVTYFEKCLPAMFVKHNIIEYEHELSAVSADDANREEKIEQFRNNIIQVMITTTILERGVTFPSVDVAVLDAGHDVFDEAALVQIAGRAGRSAQDPTGDVVFFHKGRTKAMSDAIKQIRMMNNMGAFQK